MPPIITDSHTVLTRITRQDGKLTLVVEHQEGGFSEDQLDALCVAIALGRRHITQVAASDREAFQQKVSGFTPAPM